MPVLVLEGLGVGESFGRSKELVRGNGWNVSGTMVVTFLILILVGIAIGLVLSPLPDAVSSLLSGVISGTLVAPFLALVVTLGYFRLRSAKGAETPQY